MSQALVHKPEIDPPAALTPMGMIETAVANGANIDVIDRLMTLQERWAANQAKMAFIAARSAAMAEISTQPIIKNRVGNNSTRYADFDAYAKVVNPILARHGLGYSFETSQDGQIKVTCVLSHRDGHETRNTLAGAPDTSGNKNGIQAVGSTLSYLSRYTFMAALGLSSTDDDDGRASVGDGPITDDQAKTIRELAEDVGADIPKLCAFLKIGAIPELSARDYPRAIQALQKKRKEGK